MFVPFAMNLLDRGWTVENVNKISYNEQAMLDLYRWKRKTTQATKTGLSKTDQIRYQKRSVTPFVFVNHLRIEITANSLRCVGGYLYSSTITVAYRTTAPVSVL